MPFDAHQPLQFPLCQNNFSFLLLALRSYFRFEAHGLLVGIVGGARGMEEFLGPLNNAQVTCLRSIYDSAEELDPIICDIAMHFTSLSGELTSIVHDIELLQVFLRRKFQDASLPRATIREASQRMGALGPFNEDQTVFWENLQEFVWRLESVWDKAECLVGQLVLYPFEEIAVRRLLQEAIPSALSAVVDQQFPDDLPPIWADRLRLRAALQYLFRALIRGEREKNSILLTGKANTSCFTLKIVGRGEYNDSSEDDFLIAVFSRSIIEMHGGRMMEERGEQERVFRVMLPMGPSPCMEGRSYTPGFHYQAHRMRSPIGHRTTGETHDASSVPTPDTDTT